MEPPVSGKARPQRAPGGANGGRGLSRRGGQAARRGCRGATRWCLGWASAGPRLHISAAERADTSKEEDDEEHCHDDELLVAEAAAPARGRRGERVLDGQHQSDPYQRERSRGFEGEGARPSVGGGTSGGALEGVKDGAEEERHLLTAGGVERRRSQKSATGTPRDSRGAAEV